MNIFNMEGGHVYTNLHGRSFFPLPNPPLTTCANPSNWAYDDDIDRVLNEEEPVVGNIQDLNL